MKDLISCLTVTRDDRMRELERSVRCFDRQIYRARELIIVHDGSARTHADINDLAQRYPDNRILVHREQTKRTLGYLRNLSVEMANGPIVCQWDDDDLYHPLRLERQYDCLERKQGDFCFFTDQLHWFEGTNHLYWDDWNVERYPMNLIQGTIMGRRDKLGLYADLRRGEDTPLVIDIVQQGHRVLPLQRSGYLYVYVYNGRNAWDFEHHAAISAWKRLREAELRRRLGALMEHLPAYDWSVDTLHMPHDSGVLEIEVAPKIT